MRRKLFIDATLNPKIMKSFNSKQGTGFNEATPFLSGFRRQPFYGNIAYLLQSHRARDVRAPESALPFLPSSFEKLISERGNQ